MAKVYDPEQLSEAEDKAGKHSKSGSSNSSSTAPGNISYNSGDSPPKSAATDTSTSPGKASYSSEVPDSEKSLYNSSSTKPGRLSFKGWGGRKKALVGGGLATAGVGGAIAFFTVISGPLQLIQLSQVLQKPMGGLSRDNELRAGAQLRYWKTGDIGKTRVTTIGSRIFDKKIIPALNANGISLVDRNPATGRPGATELDSSKHPATKGMRFSDQDRIKAMARAHGVPESAIKFDRSGPGGARIFRVSTPPGRQGLSLLAQMERSSLAMINQNKILNGRIHTSNEARIMKRHFGQPRLFSGLTKYTDINERVTRWWGNKLESKAERAKERDDRRAQQRAQYSAAAAERIRSARESVRPSTLRAVQSSAIATAATCIARDIAGGIALANRAAVVVPSTIEVADKMAIGSQVQAGTYDDGSPLNMSHLGVVVDGFKNDEDGTTIWDAKGMKALAGNGKVEGGVDMAPELKQAFSNEDLERKIKDEYDIAVFGFSVGGVVCHPLAIIGQAAAFGLITAGSCVGSFATLGAAAPACAASLGRYVASGAATYAVLAVLSPKFIDALSNEEISDFTGAQGGNLMAHAALEAANITARASGGVKLSEADTARLEKEQQLADQQEFQSKPFLSKLFDVHDHRSLAASFIQKSSSDPLKNTSSLANSILDVGGTLKKLGSLLAFPKVQAQEEDYDFGFPRYGLPREILDRADFENPYANADTAAGLFDQGLYIDRVKKCFGVDIKKDSSGMWTAVAVEDVNPASSEYHRSDSNCNEANDNWWRVQLFVFDSRLADSMACYDGDEEACSNMNVSSASNSGAGSPQDGAGTSIDIANIYKDSSNISCAQPTRDMGIHDGYHDGSLVKIRLCAVPNLPSTGQESNGGYGISGGNGQALVNSRVSGAVYSLVEAAKKERGLARGAASTFRTMSHQQEICAANSYCRSGDYRFVAQPGTSNHQMGIAIDFYINNLGISTSQCIYVNNRCTAQGHSDWEWLEGNADKFGLKPYINEFWHWSPSGN